MSTDTAKMEEAVETLQDADASVAEAVEPYRKTPAVKALSAMSEVGDQPQLRSLCGVLIGAGLVSGNGRLLRAGAKMLLAHELATAAKNFVKKRVDRTRPRSRDQAADAHEIRAGRSQAKEETSFPSGHSAGAASVAQAFAGEFPEYRAAAYAAAGAVALAQIPRCAHYPTDVGAGIAIGLASAEAVDAAWRGAEAALSRD